MSKWKPTYLLPINGEVILILLIISAGMATVMHLKNVANQEPKYKNHFSVKIDTNYEPDKFCEQLNAAHYHVLHCEVNKGK